MKISITFTHSKEEDGYESQSCSTRSDVDDLYEAAQFLTDAFRGAGFSYVMNVGFEQKDGKVIFGEF